VLDWGQSCSRAADVLLPLFVLSYSDMPSCSGHLVLGWLVYCVFGSQSGGMLPSMDFHHWAHSESTS
jgi:hypothetical protein